MECYIRLICLNDPITAKFVLSQSQTCVYHGLKYPKEAVFWRDMPQKKGYEPHYRKGAYAETRKTFLNNIVIIFLLVSTVKTCVKPPLSKRPKIGFQDQLSLNAGQKYCRKLQRENSAILSTSIKLPFVIKSFVLSIFEWPFYTGFTVYPSISQPFIWHHLGLDKTFLLFFSTPNWQYSFYFCKKIFVMMLSKSVLMRCFQSVPTT